MGALDSTSYFATPQTFNYMKNSPDVMQAYKSGAFGNMTLDEAAYLHYTRFGHAENRTY